MTSREATRSSTSRPVRPRSVSWQHAVLTRLRAATVTPGVVTVCITSYPPFMFYNNINECPDPCPYPQLKGGMPRIGNAAGLALEAAGNPTPNLISADNKYLHGFDRDVIELVFVKMLSLPVTFVAVSSFANLYIALLDGKCDVAITASQMDPTISQCAGPVNLTKATAALFDYTNGAAARRIATAGSAC